MHSSGSPEPSSGTVATGPAPIARKQNAFDFLRLFAATCVVITHATMFLADDFVLKPLGSLDGVGIFFVISGMFVYRSGERLAEREGGWREYARNRYLRVAPALYAYTVAVAVLLVVVGAVVLSDLFTPGVAVMVALTLVLAPGYDPQVFADFGTGDLNGALWSIPAEVSFYVAVPVLYLIAKRFGFDRMLLLLLPVAIFGPLLGHLAGGPIETLLHHTFVERLGYFMAGVFWSRYWEKAPKHLWLFLAACAVWFALTPIVGSEWYRPVALAIPLSYAVIYAGYNAPSFFSTITHRVGDISFGTYIWHMPIINYFVWRGWTEGWWTVVGALLLAWAFGAASWWLVERRFLLRKRMSARQEDTGERVAA